MNCKELIDSLDEYLDRVEVSPSLILEIEEHLKLCPPCMNYWRSYRDVAFTKLDPEAIEVPKKVGLKIRSAIDSLIATER